MATTFNWEISQLDCYPQADNQTDVVFNIHWRCTGTDGNYTGTVYSTASVPAPTDSFTEFADLTQEQVLGWVWANGVDQASTEAAVQAQIDNQANPPVLNLNPPWSV
jgi:hypothetical protein